MKRETGVCGFPLSTTVRSFSYFQFVTFGDWRSGLKHGIPFKSDSTSMGILPRSPLCNITVLSALIISYL